jgi:hypothetical protein
MADPSAGEVEHRLPRDPVHLFQMNTAPDTYHNPMGCGAFSTSMALSVYDPARFGNYGTPRDLFSQMLKVPFFGGTFENQNAAKARRTGFCANSYGYGTLADLAAAIDLGAPTVILINPNRLGIGQHDVLLVGYSVDGQGNYLRLFIDNPWEQADAQPAPPGLSYPGNQTIAAADLAHKWTGVFTPIFSSPDTERRWCAQMRRG